MSRPEGVRAKFRDVKGFLAAGFWLVGRERGALHRLDHGDACVVGANFLWASVDGDDVLPENRRWTTREPPNGHAAAAGRDGNPETGNARRSLSAGRPGKSGRLHLLFILLASYLLRTGAVAALVGKRNASVGARRHLTVP